MGFAFAVFHDFRKTLTGFQDGVYGYGRDPHAPKKVTSPLATARSLYKTITENFGSLVFCRRYLERLGVERYLAGVSIHCTGWQTEYGAHGYQMNHLVSKGIVDVYPPLMDVERSYSAQFEHVWSSLMRNSQS